MSSGLGTTSLWSFTPKRSLIATLHDHENLDQRNVLISSSGQIGHILETIADADSKVNIYVQYSEVETMARELLLIAIVFDFEISVEERSEMFLEVFANAKLREKTFNYLKQVSKKLLRLIRHEGDDSLQTIIDLSNLKYRNLDELEQSVIYDYSQQECDIDTLREHRLRGYYGERFDVRLNLIDWDYVMNLKKHASIIDKPHFTEWRMLGQAFEVREAKYTIPNKTLLSYRRGKKKSTMTSVKVLGYWGDVIASPYLVFGIEAADRPDLFELRGEQHKHTACDVSRRNVQRLLERIQIANSNVKVIPILDMSKAKFEHMFDCVLMPIQSQIQPADLRRFARRKCQVRIEAIQFIPCLSEKTRFEYEEKIRAMAKKEGWEIIDENMTESGEQSQPESTLRLQTFLHFITA